MARLREFYEKRNGKNPNYNILFYNLAISGATSDSLVGRFEREAKPRLEKENDNVVIFEFGKNDASTFTKDGTHPVEKDRFEKNVRTLCGLAKGMGEHVVLLGLGVVRDPGGARLPDVPGTVYTNEAFRGYDEILKRVAKDEGVHFVAIAKKLGRYDPREVFEDPVHLNAKGHAVLFRIVKNYLNKSGIMPADFIGKMHSYPLG